MTERKEKRVRVVKRKDGQYACLPSIDVNKRIAELCAGLDRQGGKRGK